jgi:GT2 family glycosyltransferase
LFTISLIILNFNTTGYVERLINSISNNVDVKDYEIIVADNNSSDKSFRLLKDKYPFIKIVENEKNLGFASGNNSAVRHASGKYLLFLNPDIIIIDNSVDKLIEYMEENPDTGIISGLMLDESRLPLYFYNDFWSIEWELYQLLGVGYSGKINKLLSRKEIKESKPFEVGWFHGAYIFISKRNYEKVKGFSELHFMYFEDMELCYDVKNLLELKNVCLPYVQYIHETRATFKDYSNDDLYYFHINRGKLIFIQNYNFFYKNIIKYISFISIIIRILSLPFWSKYKNRKKEKYSQLLRILKLHLSNKYLSNSKLEYVNQ